MIDLGISVPADCAAEALALAARLGVQAAALAAPAPKSPIPTLVRSNVPLETPSQQPAVAAAKGDIVAVVPASEKLFQAACLNLEVDIIALDLTTRLPFYFKPPTVNAAVSRGVVFEIPYAPAIRDTAARRNIITNAAALVRATKGKGIIISSAAVHPFELRSPNDIISFAALFGMSQDQAKAAITTTPKLVLKRSAARKESYRGVLSFEHIPNAPDQTPAHKWKAARLQDADFGNNQDRMHLD